MKNILFIHQSADLYGSDKTLLILLQHLDRSKFNPIVIIPVDGPLNIELDKIDVEVHIAPVLKLYRNIFKPKNILKFFSEYKRAVKFLDSLNEKHHFDIIYSNTLAVLLGMIYAKKETSDIYGMCMKLLFILKLLLILFQNYLINMQM